MDTKEMEQGKIYFISYGSQTQIVGRFKESDACTFFFFDLLHYWNGFETFRQSKTYCVMSGVEEIRRATLPEKHALIKAEIENDCI